MTAYSGTYLHSIDLNNWYPVHNISIAGTLMSPDYMALIDAGIGAVHISLRDTPLAKITDMELPPGVITPRSMDTLLMASIIKDTGRVGRRLTKTRWLTDAEMKEVLLKADVEIEFERIRRLVAPDASSRLSCLWVAENTPIGENHIRNMLGLSSYIFTVQIVAAIRVTKSDTGWFDMYCQNPKEDYIKKYWASVPCTNIPKWEYLVEGAIKLTEQRQLDYIKKFGARI